MSADIDKEKTCKGCPDRHPGCHAECQGYLERKKKRDKLNAAKKNAAQFDYMVCDYVKRMRERVIYKQKQGRHHYS